jgi:hypothetical protein
MLHLTQGRTKNLLLAQQDSRFLKPRRSKCNMQQLGVWEWGEDGETTACPEDSDKHWTSTNMLGDHASPPGVINTTNQGPLNQQRTWKDQKRCT